MTDAHDPFAQFKDVQREGWSLFLPLEQFTMIPAGKLVAFAKIAPEQAVLDVACGTGVVAITAARRGARELEGLFAEIIHDNEQRQHFLMSRATKV